MPTPHPYLSVCVSLAAFCAGGLSISAQDAAATDGPLRSTPQIATGQTDENGLARERAAFQEAVVNPGVDFEQAFQAALDAGVDEQTLLEGRLVRLLRIGNLEAVIRMAPRLPALRDALEYGGDRFFASPMDFEAFVEAVYARRAHAENDIKAFGAYARNAFWKGPQWVELLGITDLVREERIKEEDARMLAGVRIPMERSLQRADGSGVTLSELAEGQNALLLHFWGSECEPCIRDFDRLQQSADALLPSGVMVVGLNVDEENQLEIADRFQTDYGFTLPWLLDPLEDALSLQLRIGTVPRVALISPEGEILYTGLPVDPQLAAMLAEFRESMAEAEDGE